MRDRGVRLKNPEMILSERSLTSILKLLKCLSEPNHRPIGGESAPGTIRDTFSSVVCELKMFGRSVGIFVCDVISKENSCVCSATDTRKSLSASCSTGPASTTRLRSCGVRKSRLRSRPSAVSTRQTSVCRLGRMNSCGLHSSRTLKMDGETLPTDSLYAILWTRSPYASKRFQSPGAGFLACA